MASTGEFTFEQICDRYEHCYSYLDYARAVLMKFDGVVAIGIGPKQTDYKLDPEQTCYVVFVKNKKPAIELKATDLISINSGINGRTLPQECKKR